MTLDEARRCLGVTALASADDIRGAFRRQARDLHPDRHPEADDRRRAELAANFDRAREARDILVRYTLDPHRKPVSETTPPASPSTPPPKSPPPNASPRPEPSAGRGGSSTTGTPRQRARPRTSESRPAASAPRVTMRFEEFVTWSDAGGFGSGTRTGPWIDWTRIVVWSALGVLISGFATTCVLLSNGTLTL